MEPSQASLLGVAGPIMTNDQKTFQYLLSTLLAKSSYPPNLQQQYLSFYNTHILAYLDTTPTWSSNLTHNGSHFEPSRNIQNGQSILRFCIEPLSPIAGTPSDPFNQAASLALVEEVGKLGIVGGFDRALWDFFTEEFYIWDAEEVEKIKERLQIKDRNLRLRSCLLAFDLKKEEFGIMLKGYVNFFRKSIILERSPSALILEAVKRLNGPQDETAALNKFEEFLNGRDGGYEGIQNLAKGNIAAVKGLNLVMVSFDFLHHMKSRIKIYARSYDLTFSNFKEIYALGGHIDIGKEEFDVFKTFYGTVFGLPEHWDGVTEHIARQNKRHSGVLWQFEFMHGKKVPAIKLYVSLWNFVPNDAEAAKRLKRFFATQTWELANSYSTEIEELFGTKNIEKEAGRHSYVSYSYTKEKGPYLTLYYAPKLEQESW